MIGGGGRREISVIMILRNERKIDEKPNKQIQTLALITER